MPTQITGQAQGLIQTISQKAGQPAAVSTGWHNELVKSDLVPRYAYLNFAGSVFTAAQTAGTVAIALTTGGTTLVLFNPNNSGKNLVLLSACVTLEAEVNATQQASVLLGGAATGATQTLTTPLAAQSGLVGNGVVAAAKPLVSSTFTNTAVALRYLGAFGQSANATAVGTPTITSFKDEIAGEIVVPPGAFVGVYVLTGGTLADVTLASSFSWAELPV